jgi:hypothetical protein
MIKNMDLVMVYLATFLLTLGGCALFERSPDSGYAVRQEDLLMLKSKLLKEKQQVESTPDYTDPDIAMKAKMKVLEGSLGTQKEVEQYSKVLPLFKTDDEKIDFLSLPGYETRQIWLQRNKVAERTTEVSSTMKTIVDNRDLALRMPASLVKKSWGEPDSVEVSGNPKFKNERWLYHRMVPQTDGYKKEKRIVYFEGGVVIGWEVE